MRERNGILHNGLRAVIVAVLLTAGQFVAAGQSGNHGKEFVQLASERLNLPSDISKMLKYVEGVFILRDNEDAPVYVFEIGRRTTPDALIVIDAVMRQMNIAACFIPAKKIKYIGKLTAVSMGVLDKVREVKARLKSLFKRFDELEVFEDER